MGTKKPVQELIIVIDQREKKPYRFARSETVFLETGDYSIKGLEKFVAVERKEHSDVFSSLGNGRARFEREMQRMAKLDYAAIVIETSLPDFLHAPKFSHMNPRAAISTLISWSIKYGIHIFFAGDRIHATALTRKLLEKYLHYHLLSSAQATGGGPCEQ